jgi:predicted esterase
LRNSFWYNIKDKYSFLNLKKHNFLYKLDLIQAKNPVGLERGTKKRIFYLLVLSIKKLCIFVFLTQTILLKMKYFHPLITFLIFSCSFFIMKGAMSQQTGMYFKVEVRKHVTLETNFLLYLPEGYELEKRQWPLLLFLHGRGETGDMLDLVKKNGPSKMIEYGYKFPFIVVSPQCPEEQTWSVDVLDMLLNEMVRLYRVDTNRIYVTGLSMGGTGTWDLAIAYPARFAAIVPICGRVDPGKADRIKNLPVWVFHGAKDDIIPAEISENMVKALKALGSPVRFTLYPVADHDSWTEAYNSPELWEWLSAQHR